jgi:hypothetical protein
MFARAVSPVSEVDRVRRRRRRQVDANVVVGAVAAAAVVLMLTRWPIVAAGVGTLVAGWRFMFAAGEANKARRRLDGIAKWLEDLRDLQQGSNLDLVETLTQASARAPKVIEVELVGFASRLAHHVPLSEALCELADELDHPVADTAVAAMVFAAGHASGSALFETFEQLAATARDELTARDRIDRMRLNFERSMRRMLAILAGLLVYLRLVTPETTAPYRTATGQAWMVVPLAIWAGALLWLRSLSQYQSDGRFVSRGRVAVEAGR